MSDPCSGAANRSPARRAPSVAVLVELLRTPLGGGHVKCWERFAESAAGLPPDELGIDLTVYFLGERQRVEWLTPQVRLVSLRPLISTAPLIREGGMDVTDLTPHHPVLARLLPRHDVWHLTHTMAFSMTAARLSGRQARRRPRSRAGVVASIHTDVPALTAAFVRQLAGGARPSRWAAQRGPGGDVREAACAVLRPAWPPVDDRGGLPGVAAALVRRHRDRLLRACDHVLVPTPTQRDQVASVVGAHRVSTLGRGVDLDRFHPDPSARAVLNRRYGIPGNRALVLFAGRVDASKRVMVLAEAIRLLRDRGRAVHLVVAGAGPHQASVRKLLGDAVTTLGALPQEAMALVYAGCDVFAFPSRSETIGNVVGEAMACGLPVLLPAGARTTCWLASPGEDGLLVSHDDPVGWTAALARLLDDPHARRAMGERATASLLARHRTWPEVLKEDLLPLWRRVTPGGSAVPDAPRHAAPGTG